MKGGGEHSVGDDGYFISSYTGLVALYTYYHLVLH